jgi:hypothetical protein
MGQKRNLPPLGTQTAIPLENIKRILSLQTVHIY